MTIEIDNYFTHFKHAMNIETDYLTYDDTLIDFVNSLSDSDYMAVSMFLTDEIMNSKDLKRRCAAECIRTAIRRIRDKYNVRRTRWYENW